MQPTSSTKVVVGSFATRWPADEETFCLIVLEVLDRQKMSFLSVGAVSFTHDVNCVVGLSVAQ